VLPPLLFSMSVATTLHLLLRWREHQTRADTEQPIETTWRELRWAVIWSGLTTMVGFLSLSLAPVAPVARLGLAAAGGMALLTAASLWGLPRLVSRHANRRIGTAERRFDLAAQGAGRALARRVTSHPRRVIALALALAGVAVVGLPRLRVESNAMRYLQPAHPLRAAVTELEQRRLGVAAVQLLIETGPALDLGRLAELERQLADLPGVLAVAGPGRLPHPLLDPLGHHLESALWWQRDAQLARVFVSIPTGGTAELDQLRAGIVAAAGAVGIEASLTGTYVELLETQRRLLRTLGLSLVVSVLTITLVLWVLLGRLRVALVALVPNLWPVVLVLGAMGWFGIPLDVATVLVGAVVLGIAVDDSLHLLGGVRQRRHLMSSVAAVVETVAATTPAFLLTGLVLVLGFGVCGFSQFLPTARFGLLAAAAIALAVVADLFLLPALLVATDPQNSGD
jgi:predicted RND superfamily exporter protein